MNGRSIVVYRSTVDIRDDILNVQPTRGTIPRMRKPRTRLRKPTTPTRGTLFPHGGHATPGGAELRALRMSCRTQHRPSTSNRACLTRFDGVTNVPLSLAYDMTSHAIVRRELVSDHDRAPRGGPVYEVTGGDMNFEEGASPSRRSATPSGSVAPAGGWLGTKAFRR